MIRNLLYFFLLFSFTTYSQSGKITGKIVDSKTGETLPGATILIDGTTKAASADFDGNFSINNAPVGKLTVVISYISYDTKKITGVEVKNNDVTNINIQLDPSASQKDLNEVVVTVTLNKENTSSLILQQKNNISVSDGVSAETIKRTPDRNTSDVLKRVSGAAIQDNKFAIIRGLNERYNAAYLNGAPLPSSESDRKAFSFDIFPSNMLDNLVITKTARADMPAEFAGGIIEINTKSIPEKNFISFSTQGGYNSITTGKDQLYYKGGKKDWLGVDDGTRAMPNEVPYYESFPVNIHEQAKLAQAMPVSNWGVYSKKFAPNYAFQFSTGYNFKLKKDSNNVRDFFGVLFSTTYNRTNSYFTTTRKNYTNNNDPNVPSELQNDYLDKTYSSQVLLGSMLNLSCKLNENHIISSKNLYSINSDDRTILREGTPTYLDINQLLLKSYAFWFTGNRIGSSQLSGEHYMPKIKLKVNWLGSLSDIKRNVSIRRTSYSRYSTFNDPTDPYLPDTMYQANVTNSSFGNDYAGNMLWSKLNEQIKSFKADVSRPFKLSEKFKVEIKVGGLIQKRERGFDIRQLSYSTYKGGGILFVDSLKFLGPDQIFSQQNMGLISPGYGGFKVIQDQSPKNPYTATSNLQASYLMFDFKYSEWFRGVIGARLENYNQKLTYNDAFYVTNHKTITKDTTVLDILPSSNLIFSLNSKQNIRLSYSQTLNRPEFRELAPFKFYDFNTQFVISGNDSIKRAKITNYDLRYEIYPGRSQLFSVSGFYKYFDNPIEQLAQVNANEVTYANVPKAKAYGFEVEYRIIIGALHKKDSTKFGKFLDRLTFFTNYARIKSVVDVSNVQATTSNTRPLQGQSPYIVNGGITYVDNDNGYSISGIVNRVGQRIYIVGNSVNPDIWENGRTVIDLNATKSFFKNKFEIRFNIRDLLAKTQLQYFYQNKNTDVRLNKKTDDIMWATRFGTTYALQLTLKF